MPRLIYKNAAGKRVPGVTTITRELGWAGENLKLWANKLGLEGYPLQGYMDNLADIGTLAHQMVTDTLLGKKTDTSDYSAKQIEKAKNCLRSYQNWLSTRSVEPINCEIPLVSEQYQYGGTADFYGKIDGKLTLLDYKTGKFIFDEHIIQVAGGYAMLLAENNLPVDEIVILSIPRSDGEAFSALPVSPRLQEIAQKVFKNCLETYKLHYQMKGE